MTKEKFKLIPALHLFLIRDGKILLLRRFNTGFADGQYGVPAGHHDGGEPVTKGMAREAREEAGVSIDPKDLKIIHVMHKFLTDERVDFFFTANKWAGEPYNAEPHKCDDLSWFPLNNLPENMVPYVRKALENYQKGELFSEFGWDKQV